jgi:hypothetical protein
MLLTAFNVANQTFFMGLFFLLSGYFSSIAAKKRTRTSFLKEKAKRLGVPMLVYSALGKGLMRAIVARRRDGANWVGVRSEFMQGVMSTRGVGGPMWYTALLLVFDTIYTIGWPQHFSAPASDSPSAKASAKSTSKTQIASPRDLPSAIIPRPPGTWHVLITLLVAGLSSFIIRTQFPFGHIFLPLNLNFGYLPQYMLYYSTGIYFQRSHIPLNRPCSARTIATTSSLAVVLSAFSFSKARSLIATGNTLGDIIHLAGGGLNTFALLYPLLNELVGFTLAALLLRAFHHPILSSHWTLLGEDLAKGSYAAFLVHIPVLVETMTLIDEDAWRYQSPVLKTVIVGQLAVQKSWILGLVVKWAVERGVGKGYL